MEYRYKPEKNRLQEPKGKNKLHETIKTRRDHLWTGAIIASFIIFLYTINYGITGFVTYQENIESELNNTVQELTQTKTELSQTFDEKENCLSNLASEKNNLASCQNNLQKGKSDVVACESSLSTTTNKLTQKNQQLDTCNADKEAVESLLQNRESSYNELLKNSVINTCCSVFDVRAGNIVSWSMHDNAIDCNSGTNTINCTG